MDEEELYNDNDEYQDENYDETGTNANENPDAEAATIALALQHEAEISSNLSSTSTVGPMNPTPTVPSFVPYPSSSSSSSSSTLPLPHLTPFETRTGMRLRFLNIVATFDLGVTPIHLKFLCLHLRNAEFNPKRFRAVIFRLRSPQSTALIFSTGKVVVTGCSSVENAKLAALKYARIVEKSENLVRKKEEAKGEVEWEIQATPSTSQHINSPPPHHQHKALFASLSSSSSSSSSPVRVQFLNFNIQNLVGVTDVRFAIALELLYDCASRITTQLASGNLDSNSIPSDETESERRSREHINTTPHIKELLATTLKGVPVFETDIFPGLIYRVEKPKCVLLIFVNGKIVVTGAKSTTEIEEVAEQALQLLWYFKKAG